MARNLVFMVEQTGAPVIGQPDPIVTFSEAATSVSATLPADPAVSDAVIDNRVAALVAAADYTGNEQNPDAWGPSQNFTAFLGPGATFEFSGRSAGNYILTWEARDRSFDPDLESGWASGTPVTIGVLAVPGAFGAGDWSIGASLQPGTATISIHTLPDNGGDPITGLYARINGGAEVALGGTVPGDYMLSGFADGVAADVILFARNGQGDGPASDIKSVTTGAPVAPILSGASAAAAGSSAFTATVTTDTATGVLYVLAVPAGAAQPSEAALKAGLSHTVTQAGLQTVTGGGLQPETAYDIWFLHTNTADQDSAIVAAANNPVLTPAASTGGGNLALMTFSDPPSQAEIERLMAERWHTRPDWLYDGSAPKIIGTDALPAGCAYDAANNWVQVTGTVADLSGWDFAATETTLRIESGGRIQFCGNNRFAFGSVANASERLVGAPEPCIRFPSGSTGRIDHLYRCWFGAANRHAGGSGPTALIQANPSSGNFPRIDVMEYCSVEGYGADGIKSCWSGIIRYCFFDCAWNVPDDAEEWQSGKTYAAGAVTYSAANSYYLRRANKSTTQTPDWSAKLATTSDWDALDPHSDTNTPFFTPQTGTLEIYGCFWHRDQTHRRTASRQFNVGVVNSLRVLPNNSNTQDIGPLVIRHCIFTDEVENRFNNQDPIVLPGADSSYGGTLKELRDNRYQTRFCGQTGSHIIRSGNTSGWQWPGAATLSNISASYGSGQVSYGFTPSKGGWMRVVISTSSVALSVGQILAARAGIGAVLAVAEIDAPADAAMSGGVPLALAGGQTVYAHGLYQAGGGIDTLAPIQSVTG